MERVIVTVSRVAEAQTRDLELAPDLPIEQLAALVAQILGWSPDPSGQVVLYDVEAHPPGRKLHSNETLASAHAWDGAWLIFSPLIPSPPAPPDEGQVQDGPVERWNPLPL